MNEKLRHALSRDALVGPLLCGATGALLGMLIYRGPLVVHLAIALGIVVGFVLASVLFGRAGVDVWFTPIFSATLFALAAAALFGDQPLTRKSGGMLVMYSLMSVFLGQFGSIALLVFYDRLHRK